MAKTHLDSTSKGTLYGIRFNQKTGVSHWVTPYAWLNQGDDWYLVKYLTPTFFVKWFPFLMNMVSHEAWKVDKKEIFDNPEFQIPDNEATLKQPEDKLGASKYTIGIVGGPIVSGLIYKLTAMFLPTNDRPSKFISILILLSSFLIVTTFLFMLVYIWVKTNKNIVNRMPVLRRNIVKVKDTSVLANNLRFSMSIFTRVVLLVIFRYVMFFIGIIFWVLFFGNVIINNNEASSTLFTNGVALSLCTILFLIPSFLLPIMVVSGKNYELKRLEVKK